ncbi:hypothetical protein OF001_U10022 [Pseudomonas sp. OF001]|nr:hypothetical protein OF001_U10022 [Pseudomonas sp. OF001]
MYFSSPRGASNARHSGFRARIARLRPGETGLFPNSPPGLSPAAGLALPRRRRARVATMNLLTVSRVRYYAYYRTSPRR